MLRTLTVMVALLLAACSSQQIISLVDASVPDTEAAVVYVPYDITIKKINDRKFSSVFGRAGSRYRINAGIHRVELRYERLWEFTSDDHEVVKSDVITMDWELQAGVEYELKIDDAGSYELSKKVADKFSPWLRSVGTITKNQKEVVAAGNDLPVAATAAAVPTEESIDSYQLKQLKIWWQRSSKQDRQRFFSWVTNNE